MDHRLVLLPAIENPDWYRTWCQEEVCHKPQTGKRGAGCVLKVGGRSSDVPFVGAKQRIELLPVASQETDCTPQEF